MKTNFNLKNTEHGAAKQFILLGAPFLLYCVAIFLVSMFVFTNYVQTMTLWNAVIERDSVEESEFTDGEYEIEHTIDYVSPSPEAVTQEEKVYYDINTFPIIKWGKKWATMSIEYLGAKNVPMYEGDTMTVLQYGIGNYFVSEMPGEGGNCVLSFHVNRQKQLYYLQDIPLGEHIVIEASYGKYVYEVVSKDIQQHPQTNCIRIFGETIRHT